MSKVRLLQGVPIQYRGVEQFGSSSGSFPEGRKFKSCPRNQWCIRIMVSMLDCLSWDRGSIPLCTAKKRRMSGWWGRSLENSGRATACRFESCVRRHGFVAQSGRARGRRPRQYWFNSSRNHHFWGMGMLGVFACLASRNADGFKSHILHQLMAS